MTRGEAQVLWHRLCDSWRWSRDSDRQTVWLDRLERWDYGTAFEAVDHLIDRCERPPTIAALHQAVADVVAGRARAAQTLRDVALSGGERFVARSVSAARVRAMADWWAARPSDVAEVEAWRAAKPSLGEGHPRAAVSAPILDGCAEGCERGWVVSDARGHSTVRPCGHCRAAAFERWSRGGFGPGVGRR